MKYFIGLIAISLLLSWTIRSAAPSLFTKPLRTADRADACAMSQIFVKRQLKAPSTATFPQWTEDNCMAKQHDHVWVVRSYVDAQNSFGAMIRSDYLAEMVYNSATDTWTVANVEIFTP